MNLSLVIPVYNEEKNLEWVYKECSDILKKAKIPHEIIFVEGGSKDNSWKILEKIAAKNKEVVIYKSKKWEPGSKINAGMKLAKGKYYGYMCSDGQDNPNVIPKCIKLLEENKADFVKSKRITRSFWQRFIISRVYNTLCDLLYGFRVYDINMHPKIFKRDLVKNIDLISSSESVDLEIILRANKKGYRIIELPTKERDREGGKSSVGINVALKMIKDMFSYKWGEKGKLLNKTFR